MDFTNLENLIFLLTYSSSAECKKLKGIQLKKHLTNTLTYSTLVGMSLLLNDFHFLSPSQKSPPNFRPAEQALNNAFRVTKSNKSPINVAFPFTFFSPSPSTRPGNRYGLMPRAILQNSLSVYTFDGKRE
ncbi:hypothetical protein CEXT_347411 [Caerostris extrusa]|uniref:Uncharacterized protein n=1 Tax=Caerostris extrusa TaxID=172846 RepID=A0AAV4TPJ8_CAEEX|nr:hypothetical protein CEXT_347411 [Caerostris extrusa]